MALTPGTRLGPYEIAAGIGVGGMGEVYRATDTSLKRQVVGTYVVRCFAMRKARAARIIAVAVLLFGVSLSGCQDSLPSAPSDLTVGIVIYEHANFLGRSAHISEDVSDLKDFDGPCRSSGTNVDGTSYSVSDWNDCLSSIRVAEGWRGIAYRDSNFHGQSLQFSADVPNLALEMGTCDHDGMNDCVTSIRVFAP